MILAVMGSMHRAPGASRSSVLSPADAKDPGRRLKAAVVTFTQTGRLHGGLCVPHAVAPIEITADLRAGQVRCSVTVLAPKAGKPATRVSWLAQDRPHRVPRQPHDNSIAPWTSPGSS
jgi:hypothetical protein